MNMSFMHRKVISRFNLISAISVIFFASASFASAPTSNQTSKLILNSIEFTAPCSVKSMTIKGQASELTGQALRTGDRITSGEVKVPVKSLKTGMAMRDEHMRERIFKAADGTYPDLTFKATQSNCATGSAEMHCSIQGLFSIRGTEKPATFDCTSTDQNLSCRSNLKLSDYSIEQPSQLGIKVSNDISVDIQLKIES